MRCDKRHPGTLLKSLAVWAAGLGLVLLHLWFWVELFDLPVYGPKCETDREGRRNWRDSQEHIDCGRRRSGPVVHRRRTWRRCPDTQFARFPEDPSEGRREPSGEFQGGR